MWDSPTWSHNIPSPPETLRHEKLPITCGSNTLEFIFSWWTGTRTFCCVWTSFQNFFDLVQWLDFDCSLLIMTHSYLLNLWMKMTIDIDSWNGKIFMKLWISEYPLVTVYSGDKREREKVMMTQLDMCGDHELSHSPPALSCDHECLLSHSPPALVCVLTPDDGTREAESRAALSGGETFKNLVNSG